MNLESQDQSVVVGIDLGTTYSLVAVLVGDEAVILPNSQGEKLTPSVVSVLDSGEIVVGAAASARRTTHPEKTCSLFKREMGTDVMLTCGDRKFRPEELSAMVIRQLVQDAEAALGKPVREAVVTVPAYFGEMQRRATKDAAKIAGLHVERLLNEPTAAALAFGMHQRDREVKALVLDLGGGTFDVTALEILEGVIEIQSTAGDARLGGEDFTEAIVEWVVEILRKEHQAGEISSETRARIRGAAEQAKRKLAQVESTQVALIDANLGNGHRIDVALELTRSHAETLWQPVMQRINGPILRALADAKWDRNEVEDIILVGGATRMTMFRRHVAEMFGKLPLRHLAPDEAVAQGAAIQAALKSASEAVDDFVVTDIAPFTLGISVSERLASQHVHGIYLPILERGTVLPASRSKVICTISDRQTALKLEVYQGESSQCLKNQLLGTLTMSGLPPKPAGEVEVEVRLTYDLNGLLEVESTIVDTGHKATLLIERSPGVLSSEQIEIARKDMARLKFHPRDALPNATALARADAVYMELRGEARVVLSNMIAAFRLAIETQDEQEIALRRGQLTAATEQFRQ